MTPRALARLRGHAFAVVAFALCAFGVSRLQPRLAREVHAIKDTDDVYPFPPPPVLRLATLGYVAAATDAMWGKLLIEYGTHWTEHRPMPDIEHYLDAIVGLDSTFQHLYEYVDTLLCYRPMNGHEADARETREYLELGTRELPDSAEVWRKYGQFLAFMGPSYLSSETEKQAWRKAGALALTHAVDLGADLQYGVSASAMLDTRLGERQASIDFLQRAYALTDDEGRRAEIAALLARRQAGEAADRARAAMTAVEAGWRRDYPFLERGAYLLLAPAPDPVHCVGAASSTDPQCSHEWEAALQR